VITIAKVDTYVPVVYANFAPAKKVPNNAAQLTKSKCVFLANGSYSASVALLLALVAMENAPKKVAAAQIATARQEDSVTPKR
jgi:hypothetical protein